MEKIDEWKCSHCGKCSTATKKLDIYKAPNILILHLKRFVEHPRYQSWTKLDTMVNYPVEELDLAQFISSCHDPSLYELVAVRYVVII
jgi:ubiquitin C-terminal hydrolase